MRQKRMLLTAVGALVLSYGAFGQTKASQREQMHFSAEDESVQRPVEIPPDVLAILMKDELVQRVLQNSDHPPEKLSASWFSASIVHLAGTHEEDLIVVGEGELAGGNVVTFWVFRPTGTGHKLVLTAPAHDLWVSKAFQNGLRKIEFLAATAERIHTVLFGFDGRRYAILSEKWEDIP